MLMRNHFYIIISMFIQAFLGRYSYFQTFTANMRVIDVGVDVRVV